MKNRDFATYKNPKKPRPRWIKSALLIVLLAFSIYSFKLLIQPVGQVLGSFWNDSTTAITYMLTAPRNLKKDEGVTNMLLVGIDRRSNIPYFYIGKDGQRQNNGFLADTIIIASFNHNTQQTSLLSIPRDLWIRIPPFDNLSAQFTKINSAHALGDQYDYDGGGMQLLVDTLSDVLAIPIHYFVRVDFEGFKEGINTLGGIDLWVEANFDDYLYPREGFEDAPWEQRFQHVHFEQGLTHMDGETALIYARSRHALGPEGTDFARARRQQQVILAAKNKSLSSETLFNLEKLKSLHLTLSEHVFTNVELVELPLFFKTAQKFESLEVETYVLDGGEGPEGLLYSPSNLEDFGGAWVLVPRAGVTNFSQLQKFVRDIFYEQIIE